MIPYPSSVDFGLYNAEANVSATKYGLPETVQFCARCVISNQRPTSSVEFKNGPKSVKNTIRFDDDGICDACHVAESKADIDWDLREKELIDL